ncbi:tRNA1(Val) (adenine(37)-N6)-methyltransferase [Brochothrix thermosphacta]|nr:tRNA1(Val) (adenine(37)-N6)-methyltransferase [Brochothrix thermosphacta]
MEVILKTDERLDHLLAQSLRIIQSPSVFSFSLDAVLLANFCRIPYSKGKIMDLCSGNGVIPLLLSSKTKVTIDALEIQPRLADMAQRSVEYNELSQRIHIYEGDLRETTQQFDNESYSYVTVNPPYFSTPPAGEKNKNEHHTIARHEVMCTLEDVVRTASSLTKQNGKVGMVHRPERLIEIIDLMRRYRLEPKRIQWVHPTPDKAANTILVEAIKDGKPGVIFEPPIFVHEADGYTKQIKEWLYGTD